MLKENDEIGLLDPFPEMCGPRINQTHKGTASRRASLMESRGMGGSGQIRHRKKKNQARLTRGTRAFSVSNDSMTDPTSDLTDGSLDLSFTDASDVER